MKPADGQATFEFGSSHEDRTLVLGLRAGQVATLASASLFAVLILRARPDASGVAAGLALITGAAVIAFWPVGDRSMQEWLPITFRWASVVLRRRQRQLSPVPLLGHDSDGNAPQCPPVALAGIRVLSAPIADSGRCLGVVHDQRAGTYAAVLRVRGSSFQLADTPEKERRLAAWGAVLAGLARQSTPVHRLQWLERTLPESDDRMGSYVAKARVVPRDHPSLASYLDLVDGAGPAAPEHQTLLVVSISARRARRAIRQAGGGEEGAAKVLIGELLTLRHQLSSADVTVVGMLTPRTLAAAIRTAYDPSARAPLDRRAAAARGDEGTDPANAWPLGTEIGWSHYRTDGAWHATYWIAQWPRTAVGPDFLAPLLLGVTGTRSMSVTMEPISPMRAHREVEQAVVKHEADEELRAKAGFASTARRRRHQETATRREHELADGHADYRLAGYLTVTSDTREGLEAACGEVEQAAQQSFLELRRLNGQQDVAFGWTLPLARGLS